MNFEQLSDKETGKVFFKKKKKKYFEFQIENITFYELILFQNISIKIVNIPFQEESPFSNLNSPTPLNILDLIIILFIFTFSYFFIIEFLTIWYKENIEHSFLSPADQAHLSDLFLSSLSSNLPLSKFLINIETSFNSNLVDFLNIYGYLK